MRILLPQPPLFSFSECRWFLDRGYDECLHRFEGDTIVKTVRIDGAPLVFAMRSQGKHLVIEILHGAPGAKTREQLRSWISGWLDLGRNLQPFYAQLKAHPRLAWMAKDFRGLRLIGIPDLYESLCWSIIGQQINLAFAYKLKRRFVENYGESIRVNGTRHLIFPLPERVMRARVEDLQQLQFSRQKIEYLINVSRLIHEGRLSKARLEALPTAEEKHQFLTGIKGIGTWTANYTLMKTLNDTSAIPHGDAGLLNALLKHKLIKDKKDKAGIEKTFRHFKGWEAYLTFYLWRSLAVK